MTINPKIPTLSQKRKAQFFWFIKYKYIETMYAVFKRSPQILTINQYTGIQT